tara:strand:+ start:14 stop:772 length:759 start_codon:yes stop_codon:yes gene_type:complete
MVAKSRKDVTLSDMFESRDDMTGQPWNFHIFHYISPYVSYFFARFIPLTPNQISYIWGFLGVFGSFFIALGGYWNMVIGILIYHFAILLDYIDGEIARAMDCKTIGGTYLDRFFHYLHRGTLVLGLGIGHWRMTGDIWFLTMGVSACLFFTFDNLNKLKIYETLVNEDRFDLLKKRKEKSVAGQNLFVGNFKQRVKSYTFEMLRINNPWTLLFFTIIFNVSEYYLILMAVIAPLFFLKGMKEVYKEIGNIPS